MKLLFVSDIHGVPAALKKFLAAAEKLAHNRIVLLGDALYHGPRNGVPPLYDPKEVAALLNAHKSEMVAVRGNCDSEVDQMMLEFPVMADFAEILTPQARFFVTHGHRWNEKNLPPLPAGTILVHGHTHIPVLKELEDSGITVFNPGSISLPKGGHAPSFGYYDGGKLQIVPLD